MCYRHTNYKRLTKERRKNVVFMYINNLINKLVKIVRLILAAWECVGVLVNTPISFTGQCVGSRGITTRVSTTLFCINKNKNQSFDVEISHFIK